MGSKVMRVLVCGGRDFDSWAVLCGTLDKILFEQGKDVTIIQGGAKGADFLAKVWAKFRNLSCEEYPADWKTWGKAAGSIRNQEMLEVGKPDLVVAFSGGNGTRDMINRAKKSGFAVLEVTNG
jgi:hypothetical protein